MVCEKLPLNYSQTVQVQYSLITKVYQCQSLKPSPHIYISSDLQLTKFIKHPFSQEFVTFYSYHKCRVRHRYIYLYTGITCSSNITQHTHTQTNHTHTQTNQCHVWKKVSFECWTQERSWLRKIWWLTSFRCVVHSVRAKRKNTPA